MKKLPIKPVSVIKKVAAKKKPEVSEGMERLARFLTTWMNDPSNRLDDLEDVVIVWTTSDDRMRLASNHAHALCVSDLLATAQRCVAKDAKRELAKRAKQIVPPMPKLPKKGVTIQ